ncbi:MAG: hypothetical protein WCO92_05005 [Verrucomicrobiota bacterium]
MHLINDALQSLTAPLTGEQLGEMHKGSLGEIAATAKQSGMPTRDSSVATKVEQIMSKVASSREEIVKGQDQKFLSLIESFKSRSGKGQAEQPFKPGSVKAVAPLEPAKQAERASFEEYLSFAQNPANAGKIILGVRRNGIESGRCVLEKQKGNNYIAVIGGDQVAEHLIPEQQREITDGFLAALRDRFGSDNVDHYFSEKDNEEILKQGLSGDKMRKVIGYLDRNVSMDVIDRTYEEAKTLKAQITMLGKQFDQVGIEGGARNKKIANQAKLLEEKGRDLRAQLEPFKKYPNKNIQNYALYVMHQLDRAIDEVGQLVEATQRNRKLVDGLGLEIKPWHGKPLSKKEGEEIIENQDPSLTWRYVGEEDEVDSGAENKISFDQASDDEHTDDETDVESVSSSL